MTTKTLMFVWHDCQRADFNYRPQSWQNGNLPPPKQNGEPEVRLGTLNSNQSYARLPSPWQFYWYGFLQAKAPLGWTSKQLLAAWKSLTVSGRAFTDHCSWSNGLADFVQKIHLNKSPFGIQPITCGGNVVSVIGHRYQGGHTYYQVECFNPSKNVDISINANNSPWLIHTATISTIDYISPERWMVIPFGQLAGNDVNYPLCSPNGMLWFVDIYLDDQHPITIDTDQPQSWNLPSPYILS